MQRRHQKVVEIAPSPNLDPEPARAPCATRRSACASAAGYVNAGTVEFLVDKHGQHYFIEMNPRIQVEHTVTEMVTGIDIVKSQIRIAEGHPLGSPEIGITSRRPTSACAATPSSAAITTEDPANNFIPDYGRIAHYRSAAGFGIRLDAGTAFSGAVITPYYDSLLVKVCASGLQLRRGLPQDGPGAGRVARPRRAHQHAVPAQRGRTTRVFRAGNATTTFIDDTPELLVFAERFDRATKILQFIGDVSVNGNPEVKGSRARRSLRKPVVPAYDPGRHAAAPARRDLWKQLGTEDFCAWVRDQKRAAAHRHHLPRRPPVADGHPPAHLRHDPGGAGGGPAPVRAVLAGDVGRRHLRRGHALPARGSLGAPGPAAQADPQHPVPDAAARGERRRLHQLPRQRRPALRQGGGADRDGHLPHLRLAQLAARHPARGRDGARGRGHRRGRDLLHRQHRRPQAQQVRPQVLRRSGQGAGEGRRPHPGHQGHGGPAAPVRRPPPGQGPARGGRPAHPPAHPRHRRHPGRLATCSPPRPG